MPAGTWGDFNRRKYGRYISYLAEFLIVKAMDSLGLLKLRLALKRVLWIYQYSQLSKKLSGTGRRRPVYITEHEGFGG